MRSKRYAVCAAPELFALNKMGRNAAASCLPLHLPMEISASRKGSSVARSRTSVRSGGGKRALYFFSARRKAEVESSLVPWSALDRSDLRWCRKAFLYSREEVSIWRCVAADDKRSLSAPVMPMVWTGFVLSNPAASVYLDTTLGPRPAPPSSLRT